MTAFKSSIVAVLLLTATVLGQNDGNELEELECYTCTMTGPDDDSCYTDPDNSGATPITACKLENQCCMTSRIDATDDPGTPLSFYRGCIPNCDPDLIGQLVTTVSVTMTTYETYCDVDRCNNGPGNTKPGSGGDSDGIICCIQGIVNKGGRLEAAPLAVGALYLLLMRRIL